MKRLKAWLKMENAHRQKKQHRPFHTKKAHDRPSQWAAKRRGDDTNASSACFIDTKQQNRGPGFAGNKKAPHSLHWETGEPVALGRKDRISEYGKVIWRHRLDDKRGNESTQKDVLFQHLQYRRETKQTGYRKDSMEKRPPNPGQDAD